MSKQEVQFEIIVKYRKVTLRSQDTAYFTDGVFQYADSITTNLRTGNETYHKREHKYQIQPWERDASPEEHAAIRNAAGQDARIVEV